MNVVGYSVELITQMKLFGPLAPISGTNQYLVEWRTSANLHYHKIPSIYTPHSCGRPCPSYPNMGKKLLATKGIATRSKKLLGALLALLLVTSSY